MEIRQQTVVKNGDYEQQNQSDHGRRRLVPRIIAQLGRIQCSRINHRETKTYYDDGHRQQYVIKMTPDPPVVHQLAPLGGQSLRARPALGSLKGMLATKRVSRPCCEKLISTPLRSISIWREITLMISSLITAIIPGEILDRSWTNTNCSRRLATSLLLGSPRPINLRKKPIVLPRSSSSPMSQRRAVVGAETRRRVVRQ